MNRILLCRYFVSMLLMVLACGLPRGVVAQTLTFTNVESDIAADGIIDWSVVGPKGTAIGDPAFTIDILSTPFVATVSEPPLPPAGYDPPAFRRREVSDGFLIYEQRGINPSEFNGYFATGEPLLFTGADGYNNLGFEFSTPVLGFGLQMHSNFFDRTDGIMAVFGTDGFLIGQSPFSVKPIKRNPNPIFDGHTGDDSATFVGVQSTVQEIGAVLFNMEAPDGYNSMLVSNARVNVGFEGPTGLEPDSPFMPSNETPNATGGWDFTDVLGTGRWFDPPTASGYMYETTDGLSKFTMVTLPDTIGDADGKFFINDLINPIVEVLAGEAYVFSSPVDLFEVTGIDPTVDGGDPLAFPTFLEFDQLTVSFSQTPIASVPEPTSLAMLCLLGGAVVLGRRRRK